jgi:hypothetical protein
MRIQHGAEAQDEPYEKLAKAVPVSELASLRTTFCPMERDAMLDAAREIVRFFRERAPGVAEADGAEYPSALAQPCPTGSMRCPRLDFGDQPNVKANACAPRSKNSISNRRSPIGPSCRIT